MRAAAFAYGVLEALRDTQIYVGGRQKSLLEEVDTLSGVSGGSFPAAYYGLYGDRIFTEFEPRFLRKNIEARLLGRALLPWNAIRLLTPWLSRSDLASRYYDANVFDGATFADLRGAKGPRVYINASDLSSGDRFTFSQEQFDVLCSDLDPLPIATAVAASSAVPLLLSPITLKNYAGRCGYEPPDYLLEGLSMRTRDRRRYRAARSFLQYRDRERKKYVHLIDGGISDNLGLREAIDLAAASGGLEAHRERQRQRPPSRIVVIVVNAETDPNPKIDLSSAAPSITALMNSVSGAQIRRYNLESLMTTKDLLDGWRQALHAQGYATETHLIEVGFDDLTNAKERRYFKRLPTNFSLNDEQVDRLEAAGRRLLEESKAVQDLLQALRSQSQSRVQSRSQ